MLNVFDEFDIADRSSTTSRRSFPAGSYACVMGFTPPMRSTCYDMFAWVAVAWFADWSTPVTCLDSLAYPHRHRRRRCAVSSVYTTNMWTYDHEILCVVTSHRCRGAVLHRTL